MGMESATALTGERVLSDYAVGKVDYRFEFLRETTAA